jgi:hypothetical protein
MTAATLPLDIDGLDVSVEICPWRILHSDSPLQSALNMGGLLSVKWYPEIFFAAVYHPPNPLSQFPHPSPVRTELEASLLRSSLLIAYLGVVQLQNNNCISLYLRPKLRYIQRVVHFLPHLHRAINASQAPEEDSTLKLATGLPSPFSSR